MDQIDDLQINHEIRNQEIFNTIVPSQILLFSLIWNYEQHNVKQFDSVARVAQVVTYCSLVAMIQNTPVSMLYELIAIKSVDSYHIFNNVFDFCFFFSTIKNEYENREQK